MVEVRGAITVGIDLGMDPWLCWLFSCVTALAVCPFLLLTFQTLLKRLKETKGFRTLVERLEETFRNKADKIGGEGKKSAWKKALGIFLFVAIPLPMTGVWTGSVVAAYCDLDWKYSVPAVVVGNFFAGFLITIANVLLGDRALLLLYVLAAFIVVTVVVMAARLFRGKKEKKLPSRGRRRKKREV